MEIPDRETKAGESSAMSRAIMLIALVLTEIVLLFQIVRFVQNPVSWGGSIDRWAFLADFNHYYATGLGVLRGGSPYCTLLSEFQTDPRVRWHVLVLQATNPPFFAMLTSPLAFLSIENAWLAWQLLLFLSLIASGVVLGRNLKWSPFETAAALFLCLQSGPAILNFRYAQIQPLLLLLAVLGWASLRKSSPVRCGIYWGLGFAIKFYLWPLLFFLLLRRSWKAFVSGCLVAVICLASPLLFFNPGVYEEFARCGKPIIEKSALFIAMNFSLGGIVQHSRFAFEIPMLKNTEPPFAFVFYWGPLVFAGAMLSVAAFVLRRKPDTKLLDLGTGAAVILGFISSPVAWPHYFVFTLFLAALLYRREKTLDFCLLLAAIAVLPFENVETAPGMSFAERLFLAWRPLPSLLLLAFVWWRATEKDDELSVPDRR